MLDVKMKPYLIEATRYRQSMEGMVIDLGIETTVVGIVIERTVTMATIIIP